MASERYSLVNPWGRTQSDNGDDNCDIQANSSESDDNENIKNKNLNNTRRNTLIENKDRKKKKKKSNAKEMGE